MAKVAIVFKDTDDGFVKTAVKFDPPADKGDTPTPAQAAALSMLELIREQARKP